MTSNPTGTSQYLWAVQHMQAIAKVTGFDIVVQESAGSEENMLRLARQRTAHIGAIDAAAVKSKLGDNHDIRHFANYAPIVWQIIVAEDSNIRSLKDLHGKKFNPGPTGGGSTRITIGILEVLGIKPDYFEATLNDALDAYADRRIVGLSYRGTGSSPTGGVVEAGASRPVTFIPFTDEEIAVGRSKYPYLTKAFIEANVYARQPEPIPSIGTWSAGQLGVRKDVAADIVYTLLKAFFQTLPEVGKAHPSIARVTPANSVSEAMLPFHPGAVRFYHELGLQTPETLTPKDA
jgi:TRAP transporter TAXI family solute receptor